MIKVGAEDGASTGGRRGGPKLNCDVGTAAGHEEEEDGGKGGMGLLILENLAPSSLSGSTSTSPVSSTLVSILGAAAARDGRIR